MEIQKIIIQFVLPSQDSHSTIFRQIGNAIGNLQEIYLEHIHFIFPKRTDQEVHQIDNIAFENYRFNEAFFLKNLISSQSDLEDVKLFTKVGAIERIEKLGNVKYLSGDVGC